MAPPLSLSALVRSTICTTARGGPAQEDVGWETKNLKNCYFLKTEIIN